MADKKLPVRDLTQWLSDITFKIPVEYKMSRLWMAQFVFFMKTNNNSVPFLDPKTWAKYNNLEHLIIDSKEYINMIDPPTKMGTGGKAEYFASDFKEIPIATHLNNILRARLDRVGRDNQLQVNEIDKYAKMQRQKEKDRILYQREVRELINELNQTVGLPKIKESQSPYNYIKSVTSQEGGQSDVNENLIDYIRSQIQDSQDMTLFMSYIYRGDIEKAIELGMQHYLININKWAVQQDKFNIDFVNFNRACGVWYTDETSGRGTVEYIHPLSLYTSAFKEYNGEDICWWYHEKPTTFADFVRKFGQNCTDEQLKEIFEINKNEGGCHGMSWGKHGSVKGSQAKIMVGFMSCLSQDAEKFAEKYSTNGKPLWERKPLSWFPDKRTPNKYKAGLKNKMYNVWYSCYYIPPPGSKLSRNTMADWTWQSNYIFNIHKDIDMYRYGVDMRYAKSTLVVWKDDRPSVRDIQEAFMPKIRNAWHQFQNCLINDVDGVGISEDFMISALKATDEANQNNPGQPNKPTGPNQVDARLMSWKQLKQGGSAILKMTDRNGNPLAIDPQKFVISVKNGLLDKAEKYLNIILQLYNLMTTALAQNDISEGQDPKPRTAVAGIQASLQASAQGTWFVEKAVREFLIMYGERCVQYMFHILKDHKKYGYDERWEEFKNVIGIGNAMALESIEDYNPEDIGLTVSLEDVSAMKQFYVELTQVMLKDGKIDDADVEMITSAIMQNYKYGATLLTIAAKKIKREQAAQQQLMHQQKMEELQMQEKIIADQIKLKSAGKDQNIMTQGQVDDALQTKGDQLKHGSMMEQGRQRTDGRMQENAQKNYLDNQNKRQEIEQD